MKRPIIAIIGRPNVGKSTLFNRLVGRRQAIVQDEPGVTRDRHYTEATHGRHAFTLVDTGGFDPTAGPEKVILSQIRDQTQKAIEEADILIAVFDGRSGMTALDEAIVSLLRPLKKPVFYAVNKIDTPKQDSLAAEFFRIGSEDIYPISSERGGGVDDLIEAALSGVPRDGRPAKLESDKKGIPRIAVVGRPNVGKSTLINALLSEQRLVTSDIPGTTRDAVDSLVDYKGKKYLFIDTAGIRRRGRVERGVERFSLSRSNQAIKRSDLAVILIDAAEGIVEQDTKIIGQVLKARRACLILVNKWDLREGDRGKERVLSELQRKLAFIPFAGLLYISALKKTGLNAIFREIDAGIHAFSLRIPTGKLNKAFERAVSSHPPPQASRKPVKLNYITQAETRPPTFVIFCNRPDGVKQPYIRYLENSFREAFDFTGTPLVFHVRQKEGSRGRRKKSRGNNRRNPH